MRISKSAIADAITERISSLRSVYEEDEYVAGEIELLQDILDRVLSESDLTYTQTQWIAHLVFNSKTIREQEKLSHHSRFYG